MLRKQVRSCFRREWSRLGNFRPAASLLFVCVETLNDAGQLTFIVTPGAIDMAALAVPASQLIARSAFEEARCPAMRTARVIGAKLDLPEQLMRLRALQIFFSRPQRRGIGPDSAPATVASGKAHVKMLDF